MDVIGWIEVKDLPGENWLGAIKIGNLLNGRDTNALAHIFGLKAEYGASPLAPNRGLPIDASREARYELTEYGFMGNSWVTWREINDSGWQNAQFGDEWWLLLEMMRLCSESYGEDNVRLVVAFV